MTCGECTARTGRASRRDAVGHGGAPALHRRPLHGGELTTPGGKGRHEARRSEPLGEELVLAPPRPDGGAQSEQMGGGKPRAANDLASGRGGAVA